MDDSWAYERRLDYVFTQQMIWEVLGQDYATFTNGSIQAQYVEFKNDINSKIDNMEKRPSFDGQTIELDIGNSRVITDGNGVLKDYPTLDHTVSGIRFQHNYGENTMTITINNDCNVENYRVSDSTASSWGFVKEESKDHDSTIYFDFSAEGKQNQLYALNYNDPVPLKLDLKINLFGTLELVKTSEDGVVSGIRFNISGNGIDRNVTTGSNGKIDVSDLRPGIYDITEESYDRYIPQNVQRVTILGGQKSTVTFNNVLKRGSLEVMKASEDNLVEGIKFHLYGTSLSGLAVNEYAITASNGIAKFENILISGNQGYTLEEIDTAIKYVIPTPLNVSVRWDQVTKSTVVNKLKKFRVTVTKSDKEKGNQQGDGKLSGAIYGIYKGGALVDTYTTDSNGQFTTKYYVCGNDWSISEITPSEGYLLDKTVHHVGAEATRYTLEYNATTNAVIEQVIKGKMSIVKHTDDGTTQIETPENGATFQIYLKSAGSYNNAKATEKDILTCDEIGYAESKLLPYGIYTVHQISGWEGRELIADFDVYIAQDGKIYRYLINNANFMSYIKIVKKDVETGKTIPAAGTGFQIYDKDKNLITMQYTYPQITKIDTFYTNTDGYLITPQTLEYRKLVFERNTESVWIHS